VDNSKACTKCQQTKPLTEFSPSASSKLGVRSCCKSCNALSTASYRARNPSYSAEYSKKYRAANPERVKANNKKFREQNPNYAKDYHSQYRELENLRSRKNYWSDPAKQSLRKKLERQQNPAKFKERNRKYALSNRNKLNEKAARRRSLKANAKTYALSKKEIHKLYNSACIFCGKPSETMEHLIPLVRGGSHGIGNLAPACGSCNYSKAGRTVMEWRVWKRRLGL